MDHANHSDLPVVAMLPWPDRFEDFFDRIGISLESFRDELEGGWLFNYVESLQRAGVRPVLYFFSARVSQGLRFHHRATGVQVCVLPTPRLHCKIRGARYRYWPRHRAFQSLESYLSTPLLSLARELRNNRCRAILCQEYEYTRFDAAIALGRILGIPVFATYQGGLPPRSRFERLVRRIAVRRAAGLVIPSALEAERVAARYKVSSQRIARIPNPIDVRRWRPLPQAAVRSELKIPEDARVVTWQGRVEIDKKGLDVLMQAWPRVSSVYAAHRPFLLLVGGGQDEGVLRRLVDAAPPNSVTWIDRYITDRELLWRYLATADVATLPSRREGFSVAVVEAMACGLPVVAADTPGVVDALGQGDGAAGIVIPQDDVGSLAEALGLLIADHDLARRLGGRGRQRAEALFSLERVGTRLREFLLEGRMMRRAKPRPRSWTMTEPSQSRPESAP